MKLVTAIGRHLDVDILARKLKICFCILGDQTASMSQEDTQAPANVLHSYAAAVDNAEAYICLYNISYQLFQVVFIDLESLTNRDASLFTRRLAPHATSVSCVCTSPAAASSLWLRACYYHQVCSCSHL